MSEILTSVLQTVQKNQTTIYIWTVHIYRLYRRQCAKYTYIYSVHTVYYKDILRYQCTNTHYTPYLHVCIMSGDTAGQDALHSAGVEGSEDSGARSKLHQPPQEEETLMCLLQHCICVSRPCEILGDVNAEELKAGHPLHRCLVDGDGCVFSALSPVIHHQLLVLSMLSERWFS